MPFFYFFHHRELQAMISTYIDNTTPALSIACQITSRSLSLNSELSNHYAYLILIDFDEMI
ncbi:hypothetical protein CPI84_09550 [Erwinia pyrifoliae]|nr:hypothetical protein CPI84_09550 [Erwinia pyrifoliae]